MLPWLKKTHVPVRTLSFGINLKKALRCNKGRYFGTVMYNTKRQGVWRLGPTGEAGPSREDVGCSQPYDCDRLCGVSSSANVVCHKLLYLLDESDTQQHDPWIFRSGWLRKVKPKGCDKGRRTM